MSKSIKIVKKGLHVRAQKVMLAGTQCSEFVPKQDIYYVNIQTRLQLIVSQLLYVFNILLKRFVKMA